MGAVLAAAAVPFWGLRTAVPPVLPHIEISTSLSADGRYLALSAQRGALASQPPRLFGRRGEWSASAAFSDVYLVDLERGQAVALTAGADGSSYQPCLSRDGSRLAFCSEASNLVAQDNNACQDVFLWERASGGLRRQLSPEDTPGHCPSSLPDLSADGGLLSFTTYGAGELKQRLVVSDTTSGRWTDPWAPGSSIPQPTFGAAAFGPESGLEGPGIAFSRLVEGYTPRGRQMSAEIWGGTLLRDRLGRWSLTGRRRLSVRPDGGSPDGPSYTPRLAAGVCAFGSAASDLVADDTNGRWDIFVHDWQERQTSRVSVGPGGRQADADSFEPSLSDDGRFVAFSSYASLVPADRNGLCDVYLHDRQAGVTSLVSGGADGPSYNPCLSADGRRLAFVTRATNLEAQPQAPGQVYVWERATGKLTLCESEWLHP